MNHEYIVLNGKAVVDSDDGMRLEEYSDNFEEILKQENLIEYLEKQIKCYESLASFAKKSKPNSLTFTIILGAVAPIAMLFMFLLETITTGSLSAAFSLMVPECLFIWPSAVGVGGILDLISRFTFRKTGSCLEGANATVEYLKEQMVKEKEKLESLKCEKKLVDEAEEPKAIKVDISKELSDLYKKRDFYYNLGYYLRKYYKLYLEGELESRLESEFSEEEIKEIASYVQEKGPMTMKPKKQQGQR